MKKAFITSLTLGALPFIANAQLENIEGIIVSVGNIVDMLVPIVFALAILYFFWGLAQFILASGDSGARDEGRQKMIWGIVALAVMASIWGLIYFLQDAAGVDRIDAPDINIIPDID